MAVDALLYIKYLKTKISILSETFAIFNTNEKDGRYFRKHSLGNAYQMFYPNHQAAATMRKEYEKNQLSNVTVSILVTA